MVFSLRKLNCFNLYIKNVSYVVNLNKNTYLLAPLFEYYARDDKKGLSFLTVRTITENLDREFICAEMALLGNILEGGLNLVFRKLFDFPA